MKRVNLGIIGCGDMAAVHVTALNAIDEVEVAALCDSSEEKRGALAGKVRQGNPAQYPDYRGMLKDSRVDAVLVALPNFLHREVGLAVLESGRHLFMEKPLARTCAESEELLNAAQQRGLILQVGFLFRYSPQFLEVSRLLASGLHGECSLMWAHEVRPNFPHRWRYSQELSGGALVEKCCHHFDLFNWWSGGRVSAVTAIGGQNIIKNGVPYKVVCPPTEEFVVDDSTIVDNAFVNVEYDNGTRANLFLCLFAAWEGHGEDGHSVGVVTSQGKRLVAEGNSLFLYGAGPHREALPVNAGEGKNIAAIEEDRGFVRAILSGEKPFADGTAGVEAVRVAEWAEKSIAGKGVRICV